MARSCVAHVSTFCVRGWTGLATPLFVQQPFNFSRRRRKGEKSMEYVEWKSSEELREKVCALASTIFTSSIQPTMLPAKGERYERWTWKQSVYIQCSGRVCPNKIMSSVHMRIQIAHDWEERERENARKAISNETKNKHLPSGATSVHQFMSLLAAMHI